MELNILNRKKATLLKAVFTTKMKYPSTMPTTQVNISFLGEELNADCIKQRINI
jgi:hypothetical protein